jgi:CDGSH-type Zn-finger protein
VTDDARVVRVPTSGPILIQGPVRIETPDGAVVESDRFMVAICTCKRSKIFPLCDTSHRRRLRGEAAEASASGKGSS